MYKRVLKKNISNILLFVHYCNFFKILFVSILFIIFLKNNIYANESKLKIGIALSGGGARGIAHIGVLQRLEEETDIELYMISGASIGGFIGSMYAFGYSSADLKELIKKNSIFEFLDDALNRDKMNNYFKELNDKTIIEMELTSEGVKLPNSLTTGQNIGKLLSSIVALSPYNTDDFDKYKYKLRIVASDIQQGRKVVFDKGNLVDIISGTIAFPGLFKPIDYLDMKLMDGGLTDNQPTDLLSEDCDLIILSNTAYNTPAKNEDYNIIELLDRISITMTSEDMQKNEELADIIVTPEMGNTKITSFSNIDSLIHEGYKAMDKEIVKLKNTIKIKEREKLISNKLTNYNNKKYTNKNIKVDNLQFSGNNSIESSELKEVVLDFFNKKDFNDNELLIENIRTEIIRFYKSKGLVLASVIFEINNSNNLDYHNFQILDFNRIIIDEGKLSEIDIVGNDFTKISFLKNQLDIKIGDIVKISDLEKSLDNLYGLDLFSRVTYKIDPEKKKVTFFLKEKEHVVARMGANFMTDKGYRGFFELANKNIVGRGGITYLNYLFGDRINRVELSYYNTMFKKSTIFYELTPFYQDKKISLYENNISNDEVIERKEKRYGGNIEIGVQIFKNYLASFNFKNESVEFGSNEILRKNSFVTSLIFDTRNNTFFPSEGIFLSLFTEKTFTDYGSDNEPYHKIYGNLEAYFSPIENLSLQYSTISGSSDKLTPYTEYFKLGGIKILPGSSYEEFYRRQFLTTMLGVRYKLFSSNIVDGYFNYSAYLTGMWNNPEIEWTRSDFNVAFYTGLGLKTPIGPLEIGFGGFRKIDHNTIYRKAYFSFGYEL